MTPRARPPSEPALRAVPEGAALLSREGLLGRLVQSLVVTAALWVLFASVAGTVLGALGLWRAWLVLPVLVVGWVLCAWVAKDVPAAPTSRASAAALLLVSLAFGVWAATTHSERTLPRRDGGSYLQNVVSMAETGRRIIPVPAASVGGPEVLTLPGVRISSAAFYQEGTPAAPTIQPQFLVGPTAVYSPAAWFGGPSGVMLVPPLFGALVVLAVGVLTGTLLGSRWGPLASAASALVFPLLHTSRSTLSEPLALLTLVTGLLLLVVTARSSTPAPTARRTALLAGLLLGGTTLLRIDALREAFLVVPVATLYAVSGREWARRLLAGTGAGVLAGAASAVGLSHRYLGDNGSSLVAVAVFGLVVVAATWVAHATWRIGWWRIARRPGRWLAWALPALVLGAGALLASRPRWLTVRQAKANGLVKDLQAAQGLPVDGFRTYDERTLDWMAWWVGPVALVIALLVLAALTRRCARSWSLGRGLPDWGGALVIAAGSTFLTLWRAGITPDHPWADRRLLLPLLVVVVLVVVATALVVGRLETGAPRWVAGIAGFAVSATLLVPAVLATAPHAGERVESGSLRAVRAVCDALRPADVVLMTDDRSTSEWPQVLRGMCGVQSLALSRDVRDSAGDLTYTVHAVDAAVRKSGHTLVLMAAESPESLGALDAVALRRVVQTRVPEDEKLILRRPDGLARLDIVVWLGSLPQGEG